IPRAEVKTIAAGGLLFALYTLTVTPPALWGFIVGAAYGVMLAPLAGDRLPTPRRLGAAGAIALTIAATCALPLRNMARVKPEIARVIAAEEHTTHSFQTALDAFNKGRGTADALARVADASNVAELQAVDARLAVLQHVPAEHQQLVTDARDYLHLRCEAW